jgi:hypothetical protein
MRLPATNGSQAMRKARGARLRYSARMQSFSVRFVRYLTNSVVGSVEVDFHVQHFKS